MIIKTEYKLTISINTETGEQSQSISPINDFFEIYDGNPTFPSVFPGVLQETVFNTSRHQRQYTTIYYPQDNTYPPDSDIDSEDLVSQELELHDVAITLSTHQFDNLDERRVSFDCTCSICRDTIVIDDHIKDLQCGHEFHISCLRHLFTNYSVKCPLCRMDVRDFEDS